MNAGGTLSTAPRLERPAVVDVRYSGPCVYGLALIMASSTCASRAIRRKVERLSVSSAGGTHTQFSHRYSEYGALGSLGCMVRILSAGGGLTGAAG